MQKTSKTRILVECALMIALAIVLDILPLPKWPNGGSVSVSMVPIVFLSYRHGAKWGLLTGFVYCIVQIITGFYAPPAGTILAFTMCILLDYVIAFTVLGAADLFAKPLSNKLVGYTVGALAVTFIRFLCSFLSGILIWDSFAPEGQPVWLHSLTYNGGYMIPNMFLTAVIIAVLCLAIDPKTLRRPQKTVANA